MTLLEPHPVLIQLPFGPITAHGAFFALGALVATIYFACRLSISKVLRFVEGAEAAVLIFVIGLFGARFGYLVTYRSEWVNFSQLFAVWQGGLVSYWGIAAGFGYAWFRSRNFSVEHKQVWWNSVVLAGLLGWSIGRLGNYYVGDSVGVLSSQWALFYGRVPIQLFEAAACLGAYATLRRQKNAAFLGIICYLLTRLVVDTWRDEAAFGSLHVSQWIALISLIIIIPIYVRRRAR